MPSQSGSPRGRLQLSSSLRIYFSPASLMRLLMRRAALALKMILLKSFLLTDFSKGESRPLPSTRPPSRCNKGLDDAGCLPSTFWQEHISPAPYMTRCVKRKCFWSVDWLFCGMCWNQGVSHGPPPNLTAKSREQIHTETRRCKKWEKLAVKYLTELTTREGGVVTPATTHHSMRTRGDESHIA